MAASSSFLSISSFLVFSFIFLSFFVLLIHADPIDQLITSLPGLPANTTLNFKQYSGYVPVNQTEGRYLFYWFVESQRDPSTDPVLLWMNGGPGASSLLGFFTEHGPFRPNPDGKTLSLYSESWNQIANIIYLEAPAGVGFSYFTNPNDNEYDDQKTAHDNYQFLQNWFQLFPEFLSNDFYITGESYAGHYVPTLTNLVLQGMDTFKINLKGILVGNPCTDNDWYFEPIEYAFLNFMYTHALIPQTAWSNAVSQCGWENFLDPSSCSVNMNHPSSECREATREAIHYIPQPIDFYDVLAPVCPSSNFNAQRYVPWSPISQLPSPAFAPCITDYMTSYLNQPEVQSAIHARPTNWTMYAGGNWTYTNHTAVMIGYYQSFFETADLRILIFSGDQDSAVPFIGTQRWITCLNRTVVEPWHHWTLNEQIAGSVIVYDKISFLTVKGCGHMVPYYCPEKGYEFYKRWLDKGYW